MKANKRYIQNMDHFLQDNMSNIANHQNELLNHSNEDVLYHFSSGYLVLITIVGIALNTRALAILACVIKVRP